MEISRRLAIVIMVVAVLVVGMTVVFLMAGGSSEEASVQSGVKIAGGPTMPPCPWDKDEKGNPVDWFCDPI